MLEERKVKEKEFHDKIRMVTDDAHVSDTRYSGNMEKTIKTNPLWRNMKYYAIERKSRDFVLDLFKKKCKNKTVLDYCCGNGEDGLFMAEKGASKVYGIDISDISISNCKSQAKERKLDNIIEYKVSDAEHTGFENDKFDMVTEYGALHHLDLDKAYSEIARILKKDGIAVCNEALKHNILIHAYRKLTPDLRTEWEVQHILGRKEILKAKKYFETVEVKFFHLFTLLSVPLRKTFLFNPILKICELIDTLLLKLPFIKWQSWQVVIILKNPKK